MSSFVRFILKHKKEDNGYGDIARDILMDREINRAWGYRSFVKHLEYRNACARVFDLVDELKARYDVVG